MANIAPCSTITLYSGVAITNGQQIAFKNSADQIAYFNSKKISGHEETQCTYVRHNRGYIKIEDTMGVMLSCNYISWKNANAGFENKTIYARVTDFEYINNSTVKIYYTIDWFQTFMFDVTYETAIMEREQLSQADWIKTVSGNNANPYDMSVYELNTPEDLPVDKTMEKFYNTDTDVAGSTDNNPFLAGGLGGETGPTGLLDHKDYGYTQIFNTATVDPVYLMCLSDFDASDMDSVAVRGFWDNFTTLFLSDGKTSTLKADDPDNGLTHHQLDAQNNVVGTINTVFNRKTPNACNIGKFNLDNLRTIVDWLTLQGLSHMITGIYKVNYNVFLLAKGGYSNGNIVFNTARYNIAPRTYGTAFGNIVSPKLYRSPYQYIRVETMEGDTKEYNYEDFYALRNGGSYAELRMVSILDNNPSLVLIPYKYKQFSKWAGNGNIQDYTKNQPLMGYNVAERIEINAFPQIGYVTDAYLTYLSSQYTQNLQSRTTHSEWTTISGEVGNVLSSLIGGAVGLNTGNYSGMSQAKAGAAQAGLAVGPAINAFNTFIGATNRVHAYEEASGLRNLGAEDAQTIASGDAISMAFNEAKKGFVADDYHPSNANNGALYYSECGDYGVFRITRVMLRADYLRMYNKYFLRYGYTSHRMGLPRICNYMNNSAVQADLPQFILQDNGHYETYVKCSYMDVQCPMKPVADFFEQMFKNGMRFVDGSSLITP